MKIYWTSQEQKMIAKSCYNQLSEFPHISFRVMIRTAIETLPSGRRRNIPSKHLVPWLETELDYIRKEKATEEEKIKQDIKPALIDLHNINTEDLIFELSQRFLPHFIPTIDNLINQKLRKIVEYQIPEEVVNTITNPSPPPRLKMVLLINLKPNQFNTIKERFGNKFDLRSWNGENESNDRLKALCSTAYRIFGMTSHMSHQCEEIIKRNTKSGIYIRFHGGVTTLSHLLFNLSLNV